jgi:hypothetical protein
MIAMMKSMTVSTEVNCPACNGTGFPTVPQPDNPSEDFSASLQAVSRQRSN